MTQPQGEQQRGQQRGQGVTRRDFLTRGGTTLGGAALGSALLGAGALGAGALGSAAGASVTSGDPGGRLDVLTWPTYIDRRSKRQFPRRTGIALKYSEGINDNNEFFAKYQEQFSRGQHIGFDIVTPTSWLAARLIELEYVRKLPFARIPNVSNLDPTLVNPVWDPTGEYTLPWQGGMTGIAYNIAETGRELTSVSDLFDPKFRGKVGMLLEMRDTMGLLLLGDGIDPATVTFQQARASFDRLERAVDNGQVRSFTGNDYQDDLVNGDFVVNVAWSGDVAQLTLENEDLRFVIPDEGGNRWADVMCMVATSKRTAQVAAWMDYFYDPVNAAQVAAYVQFLSPVAGIEEELADLDPAAVDNPLIFPPPEITEQLVQFKTLDRDEEERFDLRFAEITGTGGGPG